MDWRKCLGCDILIQVVADSRGLAGRDYHDDECRKAHIGQKPEGDRRRFPKNDLSGQICGGVLCLSSIPRKENCWVTLWSVKCLECGGPDTYRSTDLRFNPPAACRACRRRYKIK